MYSIHETNQNQQVDLWPPPLRAEANAAHILVAAVTIGQDWFDYLLNPISHMLLHLECTVEASALFCLRLSG